MCGQQKQSNDPGNNQHNPQYANDWAPLTRKRHIPPHSAQPQHTNYWAPRTRKRHQQEHRPQRPTERSNPTQHAKGRAGDCPGPRKGATTRRNVTRGVGRGKMGHGTEKRRFPRVVVTAPGGSDTRGGRAGWHDPRHPPKLGSNGKALTSSTTGGNSKRNLCTPDLCGDPPADLPA